jgi:hypothetical protein
VSTDSHQPITPAAPPLESAGLVPLDAVPTATPTALSEGLVSLDEPAAGHVLGKQKELTVTIRSSERVLYSFPSRLLADHAIYWSQVVRNRHRWSGIDGGFDLPARSFAFFNAIGLSAQVLKEIAEANVIEVSIPFHENLGEESRIFPWEAMLSAATEGVRTQKSWALVRHLEIDSELAKSPPAEVETDRPKVLFVRSIPAGLEDWGFESEEYRVRTNLPGYRMVVLPNPTLDQFVERSSEHKPALIHFAGFDTWQGAWLLGLGFSPERRDGFLLAGADSQPDEVGTRRMLSRMGKWTYRPRCVALNVFNSAGRLAPGFVAAGVETVIGFQDVIDDELAERFFERFYRSLSRAERSAGKRSSSGVLRAFLDAQKVLKAKPDEAFGTGVVLWRAESILGVKPTEDVATAESVDLTGSGASSGSGSASGSGSSTGSGSAFGTDWLSGSGSSFGTGWSSGSGSSFGIGWSSGSGSSSGAGWSSGSGSSSGAGWSTGSSSMSGSGSTAPGSSNRVTGGGWPFLDHGIKPSAQLNYSMLHNRRDVFEEFKLYRRSNRRLPLKGVRVKVELFLGASGTCSWEQTFDIGPRQVPSLEQKVRLPLISDLQRGLRHTLLTNLKVTIEHEEKCHYQQTFPVELLAIDEWRDDEGARDLLPSFVLSGDPAIPPIVDAAQRYLRTLLDTAERGFTGYQRLPIVAGSAQIEWAKSAIDYQARAIWSALLQDHQIRYVNQPPTYTLSSQRIRTPSAVIAERHGTCIDLAVLFAACLEYVDLCPVLFLLRGHAMVGYWRTPLARERFAASGLGARVPSSGQVPGGTSAGGTGAGWSFDPSYTGAIFQMIDDGELVPIEATFLANGRGFSDSCKAGVERLWNSRLDVLLDIRSARRFKVTPLPITTEGLR